MIMAIFFFSLLQAPYFTSPVQPELDLQSLNSGNKASRNLDFWRERIGIYTETGELLQANALLEKLLEVFPQDPVFQEALMIVEGQNPKSLAKAIERGEATLKAHPEHKTIRINLARLYFRQQQYHQTFNLLLDQMRHEPLRTSAWTLLFQAYQQLKTPGDLEASLRTKMAAFPDDQTLKSVYFFLLVRGGHLDAAARFLEQHQELHRISSLKAFEQSMREFQ
jgi:lipopolysaccharide biosynthesis regulator YciM